MASDCTYDRGVYRAMAPEYNTVAAGTWILLVSSVFNRNKDGLEFTESKTYTFNLRYSPDGITGDSFMPAT